MSNLDGADAILLGQGNDILLVSFDFEKSQGKWSPPNRTGYRSKEKMKIGSCCRLGD
jgi:uncharacterized Rossmann fold enzyme